MEMHERLVKARETTTLKPTDVARELDVSVQAVSQWERGIHKPSRDNLAKLAELYDHNLDWLQSEIGPQKREGNSRDLSTTPAGPLNPALTALTETFAQQAHVSEAVRIEGSGGPPDISLWPRDLPIYRGPFAGNASGVIVGVERIGWARRPPLLAGVDSAFSIYVTGDSMAPVFRPGKRAFVDPTRPIVRDNYVLVELHAVGADPDGATLLKSFIRKTSKELFLKQFNPPKELPPIPIREIRNIFHVLDPLDLTDG